MQRRRFDRGVLIVVCLLAFAGMALAQGIGLGIGVDEVHRSGTAGGVTVCATNFVLDESDATGCNMVTLNF